MFQKKSSRLLLIVFIIYGVLVATHKGEFWPFSIYPMFSVAGKPWTRAILRDVTNVSDSVKWSTHDYPDLPGEPISTIAIGIDQIDYSNFVCKTKQWDAKRLEALKYMIGDERFATSQYMVIKVTGQLIEGGSVEAKALPFILITENDFKFNPSLDQEEYYQ